MARILSVPMPAMRILAVTPVNHPGGAEIHLLRLLGALSARGWSVTLTSPGPGPIRDHARQAGYRWASLPLGGLGRGEGAGAIRSWPRARLLAGRSDVAYLNGTVCGRLLPALPPATRGGCCTSTTWSAASTG